MSVTGTIPKKRRKYAVIDEPVDIVSIIKMNVVGAEMLMGAFLGRKVDLSQESFNPKLTEEIVWTDEADQRILNIVDRFPDPIRQFQMVNLNNMYIGATEVHRFRRKSLYDRILHSLLNGFYKISRDKNGFYIDVLIYTSTEVDLVSMCEKVVVLDGTGNLTPHYHAGLTFLKTLPWEGNINNLYIVDGEFTKGDKSEQKESVKELVQILGHLVKRIGEDSKVLVFAWKDYLNDFKVEVPETWKVVNYGGTRGSNDYSEYDTVILLGSYYKTKEYYISFNQIGLNPNRTNEFLSDAIQNLYRSGIRSGKSIDLYLATDFRMIPKFLKFCSDEDIKILNTKMIELPEDDSIGKKTRSKKIIRIVMKKLIEERKVKIKAMVEELKEAGFEGTIRKPYDLKKYIDTKYSDYPIGYSEGELFLKI